MHGIFILSAVLALASGQPSIEVPPQSVVVQTGADARLNCTPSGDMGGYSLTWKEHISKAVGALIYRTDMDDTNDPDDYSIADKYDLIVRKAEIEDAGWYTCQLSSDVETHPAFVIVTNSPVIIQNPVDFVEGNQYNMGCSVIYGSPGSQFTPVDPPSLRVSIGNRIVADEKIDVTEGASGQQSSYSMSFNFTALPEYDGVDVDCTVVMELPEFKLTSSYTLQVFHAVNSVSIHKPQSKYRVGDKVLCQANGNPEPSYQWTNLNNPTTLQQISGNELVITEDMVGNNEWNCSATNSEDGMAQAFTSISFRAEESGYNSATTNMAALLSVWIAALVYYVI